MNIMNDIVLNLILMMFPMLIYFIYNCYREVCMEKYNQLLFDVMLISSLYLCLKFGNIQNNIFVLMFCNLPIILAYLKKRASVAILLSLCVIVYVFFINHFNIYLLILKYFSYYVVYYFGCKKKIKDNTFIKAIVVLQGFFLSFDYYSMVSLDNLLVIGEMFLIMILFYILPFCLLYLFQLANHITGLYSTVSELEKDKQLKNSLFKITHEVKNPIAVCKGYLDMLDVNNKDQLNRYIPIVRSEIIRSLDIMNDFMEFSKIHIEKDIIDINMLLEDIEDEFKILAGSRKIAFKSHIMNDEIFIDGDYNRLKQVFINLIKNSMEAIEEKGNIQVVTHILKDKYYIEVIDDGIGMDEDTLSHVKDMFYTTKIKGSGLGVSLSNEIIKAHDGSLDYFSKKGFGTRVVVKLPIVVI